jgi:hypothetical protein
MPVGFLHSTRVFLAIARNGTRVFLSPRDDTRLEPSGESCPAQVAIGQGRGRKL